MNDDNTINENRNDKRDNLLDMITPDVATEIKTLTDLWSLARMTKDMNGDPVWETLYQIGCNPEPFDNLGYNLDYGGYRMIYIPMRNSNGVARFALPKLASVGIKSKASLMEAVNNANSLVTESKFAIMGDDVWLIHERCFSYNEDYPTVIEHILENLKTGTEIFYKIS